MTKGHIIIDESSQVIQVKVRGFRERSDGHIEYEIVINEGIQFYDKYSCITTLDKAIRKSLNK